MATLFEFNRRQVDGLRWWVITTVSETDVIPPLWPGLWELDCGDDVELNPYLRFGVNNVEGSRWRCGGPWSGP